MAVGKFKQLVHTLSKGRLFGEEIRAEERAIEAAKIVEMKKHVLQNQLNNIKTGIKNAISRLLDILVPIQNTKLDNESFKLRNTFYRLENFFCRGVDAIAFGTKEDVQDIISHNPFKDDHLLKSSSQLQKALQTIKDGIFVQMGTIKGLLPTHNVALLTLLLSVISVPPDTVNVQPVPVQTSSSSSSSGRETVDTGTLNPSASEGDHALTTVASIADGTQDSPPPAFHAPEQPKRIPITPLQSESIQIVGNFFISNAKKITKFKGKPLSEDPSISMVTFTMNNKSVQLGIKPDGKVFAIVDMFVENLNIFSPHAVIFDSKLANNDAFEPSRLVNLNTSNKDEPLDPTAISSKEDEPLDPTAISSKEDEYPNFRAMSSQAVTMEKMIEFLNTQIS